MSTTIRPEVSEKTNTGLKTPVLRVEAFLSTVSDMAEIICHAGWVSEQLAEIDTAEQDK